MFKLYSLYREANFSGTTSGCGQGVPWNTHMIHLYAQVSQESNSQNNIILAYFKGVGFRGVEETHLFKCICKWNKNTIINVKRKKKTLLKTNFLHNCRDFLHFLFCFLQSAADEIVKPALKPGYFILSIFFDIFQVLPYLLHSVISITFIHFTFFFVWL